jgi:hypothetical protein
MVFSSTDMFGTYGTSTFTRQRGIFKINFLAKNTIHAAARILTIDKIQYSGRIGYCIAPVE